MVGGGGGMNKKRKRKSTKPTDFPKRNSGGRLKGGGERKSENRILLFSCHQSPFGGSLTGVPCSHVDGIEREENSSERPTLHHVVNSRLCCFHGEAHAAD